MKMESILNRRGAKQLRSLATIAFTAFSFAEFTLQQLTSLRPGLGRDFSGFNS